MIYRFVYSLLPLFCSCLAFAQPVPSLVTTADEVIVTGTRAPREVDATTTKVTVIDSARIARSQDLGQLLNEQAGIVVNGIYSAPGKDRSIFLRNGANNFTLILLDGQPLVDPSALGSAVDLRLLDLNNIERIEIARGAQSLIYGSDAVAGVINLITKSGTKGKPNLSWRGSYGSFHTFESGLTLNGSNDQVDYSAGYNFFDSKGISEALMAPNEDGVPERDGARRHSANAGVTFHANDRWSIRPAIRYARFDGDFDGGGFADAPDATYENELINPSLSVNYADEDHSAGLRYNYTSTNRSFVTQFGDFPFQGRAQQADAFANKQFKDLALTLGAQVRIDKLLGEETLMRPDDKVTTVSPYLQALYDVTDRLFGEAGLRYNNHSQFGSQFNYSAGAGYRVHEAILLRGNIASSFQSPTLDQLYGPFGANADLTPQTSTSIEIGAAYRPSTERMVSLTVFQRNIDNLIVFAGGEGYANRDELVDVGVELEANTQVTKEFRVDGNLTYVKGRLSSFDLGDEPTETDEFFRRPRTTGLLGITYTPKFPLSLRVTGQYTGARPDVFFDDDFNPSTVDLDPYFLLNVYAEYKLLKAENLTLFTDLRNLTDTDFVEATGFTTQGVTFRVGFNWSLN